MNKEHIKQLAKEFCESEKSMIPGGISFLVKFAEHLIEKGEVVESNTAIPTINNPENLPDWIIDINDTRSATPGKVISDKEIEKYVTDAIKYHPYTKYKLMVNAIKWMREQLTKG